MKTLTKIITAISLTVATGANVGAAIFIAGKNASKTEALYSPSTHYEVSDTAAELTSYYSSISSSATGTTLLSALQSLNSTKRKKTMGYSTLGTSASSSPYIYTDYVLGSSTKDSNGQVYGTQIASFYTKTSATSWNREHMWPNSHGGDNVEADILHTRPTISSENSSRGNSFYVEGKNSSSSGWDPYTAGYEEWVRGECARTILYCVVAYSGFTLSDADSHSTSNANPDNMMGNMNTLIKWHFAYTPNQYEINRNNGAEYLQGNRNPFVDHPEYVAKIWSSYNSTVSSLCSSNSSVYSSWTPGSCSTYGTNDAGGSGGSQTTDPTVNSVSVSPSTATIYLDGTTTKQLTATVNVSNGAAQTVSWSSSNTSVATVNSSGLVTAKAAGTATITATSTADNTKSGSCTITVLATQPVEGDSETIDFTAQGYSNQQEVSSYTGTSCEVALSKGTNSNASKWYDSGSAVRCYGGNTITISSSTRTILKIEFTFGSSDGSNAITSDVGTYSSGTWTGEASSVTFTIGGTSGNRRIAQIKVTYASSGSGSTATLSSIAVKTAPTKTTYTAGEYFAPAGLVITATYSDSTTADISYASNSSSFTFTPSTSTALTTGNTSVTISYGGKSCSQAITVNAAAKTLSSISISGYTTSFTVGDTFSFGGTVTAHYSDSSSADVTSSASFTGYNMSSAGSQEITVSYTYGGTTKTATYNITVTSSGGSSGESNSYYEKITSTSNLESGDYLIVYETGSVAFNGGLTTLDATNNTISVTISDNKIDATSTVNAAKFTYDSTATSLISASGKYIGRSANSNGLDSNATFSSSYANTITIDSGNANIVGSGGAYLRYNSASDQARFRYFKSSSYTGQKAIQLYKYVEESSGSSAAESWGETFLSTVTCNNGVTAPSTSAWATMKSAFEALSTSDQNTIKSASASTSGTSLEQAIARYVEIVTKYTNRTNYPDYLNKTSGTNQMNRLGLNVDNTIIVLLTVGAAFAMFGFAYLAHNLKKKKD